VSYGPDAVGAANDLAQAGASVTFTRTAQAYNPTTGANSGTATSASSVAIARVPRGADVERLRALGLVNQRTIVLVVAGLALGAANFRPQPNDVVTWAGEEYTARDVSVLGPDGATPILYFVIASR
jgi:hypothetical protein